MAVKDDNAKAQGAKATTTTEQETKTVEQQTEQQVEQQTEQVTEQETKQEGEQQTEQETQQDEQKETQREFKVVGEMKQNLNVDLKVSDIIRNIITSGGKSLKSLKVKNVTITERDNYHRVTFSLDSGIPSIVTDEDGEQTNGTSKFLYSSTFALAGALKEIDEIAWMANEIIDRPKIAQLILSGATLDIVQQTIPAGEEYFNPFSTQSEIAGVTYSHDLIINHITGIKLSKTGHQMADKLATQMLIADF